MATWIWQLQGTTPTTIDAADSLQFAGGTFNSAITVATYNASMHVDQNNGGSVDDAASNTPKNNKWISSTQIDVGGGTVTLTGSVPATTDCALKINFSDGASVATTNGKFYAYQTTTSDAPTGITFKAGEQSDTTWTDAEGAAAGVTLNDDSAATSHDYFIFTSASPDSVGAKSFTLRAELTYS